MRYVNNFPRPMREIMTEWIPMPDGTRLAARIWLPEDAVKNPVPAVLEYLPYRRRDGTVYRDSITQPWLAGHGYAAVRVDIRGTGDSEGVMLDEYDVPERRDGADVVQWLASQPWCSGNVGMWGISWGGINSLQVAALAPPALKAIIPMGFFNDHYNGDCHYMGGCLLEGHMGWGHTFFTQMASPPDPAVVGEDWRRQWLERLKNITPPMATWLTHQRRDDYWKAGSISDDYARIKCAVYAINGWQDSYARSILPLLEGLHAPKKALIGPWAHAWPHIARPGPAIGFLQEALRWWDHWLKGIRYWNHGRAHGAGLDGRMDQAPQTGARMAGPLDRRTDTGRRRAGRRPWRWLHPAWAKRHGAPRPSRSAARRPPAIAPAINAPMASAPIFPTISASTTRKASASTAPLNAPIEIFGEPVAELDIESDKPQAHHAGAALRCGAGWRFAAPHLWPAQSQPSRQRRDPDAAGAGPALQDPHSALRHCLCLRARPSHSPGPLHRLLAHHLALAGKGNVDAHGGTKPAAAAGARNRSRRSMKAWRPLASRRARSRIHCRDPAARTDEIAGPDGRGNGRGQGDPDPQPRPRRLEDHRIPMSNTTSPAIRNSRSRPTIR